MLGTGVKRRTFEPRWAIVAALAVAAASWLYVAFVRENLFPKNFDVVQEGRLYRSGALTPAATKKICEQHKIKTIIDLGGYDKDPVGEQVAQRTAEALGVKRYAFRLEGDGTGNPNYYVAAEQILRNPASYPVLVHCSAGSQRTTACIALHRYIDEGASLEAEVTAASKYGHDPRRNPRLKPYLEEWAAKIRTAVLTGKPVEGAGPLTDDQRRGVSVAATPIPAEAGATPNKAASSGAGGSAAARRQVNLPGPANRAGVGEGAE